MLTAFLLAATGAKLILAALAGGTNDVNNQLNQAAAWLAGRDVFDPEAVGNAAFFPIVHFVIVGGTLRLAELTGVPFAFWIKVPAIVADLGAAWVLRGIPSAGPPAALLYMMTPLTVLLSVHHGQLHTVAAAVGAWALALADRDRRLAAAVVGAVAASVRQHFAIVLLPLVRAAGSHGARVAIAFVVVALVINLPLLLRTARPASLAAPATAVGTWGYSILVRQTPRVLALVGVDIGTALETASQELVRVGPVLLAAWALAWAGWMWRRRDVTTWRAVLVFILGFYTITPGFGVQWLAWCLPFWLAVDTRRAATFSVVAGLFLGLTYWVWGFPEKYGVPSIAGQLSVLRPADLALYAITGLLGVGAWLYGAVAAWRYMRG